MSNNRLQSLHRCLLTPGNPITLNQTICCTLDLVERTGRIFSGEELTFQKTFSLPEPVAATYRRASTDIVGYFLNGETYRVTGCPVSEPVKVPFNEGTNTIRVAQNIGACRSESMSRVQHEDGHETVIDSDDSWEWTSGRIEGASS